MACLCGGGLHGLQGDYENFQDKAQLSSELKDLQTGDILLFKSRGFTAWGIRATLQTDWDHVGVIIRRKAGVLRAKNVEKMSAIRKCHPSYCACGNGVNTQDEIEILESTSAGIHVYPMQERLARRLGHDAFVAIRKLDGFDRTDVDKLTEEFLMQVRGKGYAFTSLATYAKLGYRKNFQDEEKRVESTMATQSQRESHLEKAFCSELAAAFLNAIGVLNEGILSDSFDPGMFSSRDQVLKRVLKEGCSYKDEVVFLTPNNFAHQIFLRMLREMRIEYLKMKRKGKNKVYPDVPTVKYKSIDNLQDKPVLKVIDLIRGRIESGLVSMRLSSELVEGENILLDQDRVMSKQFIKQKAAK